MPDPQDDDDRVPQGRLDVTTLRTMGRRSESHQLVASWQLRPNTLSPRQLEIRLDDRAYPADVDGARLDVHWFVTDDYYVHYIETRGDGIHQCRWDRHPKTDAPRTHFHPPPNAGPAEGSPRSPHHLDVLFTVLEWISDRVRRLHGRDG